MEIETYITAQGLQTSLVYLNQVKTELSNDATQQVIMLTKRKLPVAPPAALTTALADVESFILAQTVTAINDQIDSLQTTFDNLQDAES